MLDPLEHRVAWEVVLDSGVTFNLCDRCKDWFVSHRRVAVAYSLAVEQSP